jgi:hypothetical protein
MDALSSGWLTMRNLTIDLFQWFFFPLTKETKVETKVDTKVDTKEETSEYDFDFIVT